MSTRPLRRRFLAAVAVTALAAGTAACGSSSAETTADGKVIVRYQSSPGAVTVPEIAAELGFFDEVELELVGESTGGPESLRALSTDQVDIANAFQGAIAKVISTGAPVKAVVASYGSSGDVRTHLAIRDDGDVKTARDLIGKKVALNTLGANSEAVLDTYLAGEGLTQAEIEKVTLVPLPGNVLEASLREKQIDAAFFGGPAFELANQRPGLAVLTTDVDVVGPYTGGSYAMHEKFLDENPEASKDFVAGVGEAIAWIQETPIEEVREVAVKILTDSGREEGIGVVQLFKGHGIPTVGGWLRDEDFTIWLDWLETAGELRGGELELDDIFTNEFNPYAAEAAFIPDADPAR
jgi:ABC-type nitrate/sulfonate/bicarbonate transport system substrate-binding protein